MKNYHVVFVKHYHREPDWSDAVAIKAEDAQKAAQAAAMSKHTALGHSNEDGTLWVRAPGVLRCFSYRFHVVPVVETTWIKPESEGK